MRLYCAQREEQYTLQNKLFATGLVNSFSFDPWYNLALEEYLIDTVQDGQIILYLWQNDKTVVIGRNQNAWKECRWQHLEEKGGKLARRLSGGGAVYHDTGNLNFTFITDKKNFNIENQLSVILDAVRQMGIDAEFSGRNDLLADKRKFSGNAYFYGNQYAMHHGTILINSDLNKLSEYLQPPKAKMESKGIDSVRSRVINLAELKTDITVESMKTAVTEVFLRYYGGPGINIDISPAASEIEALYRKYSSWEWRLGETPEFDITYEKRFEWGSLEIGINYKHGKINRVKAYSDALDCSLTGKVEKALTGLKFNRADMVKSLEELYINDQASQTIKDISEWFGVIDI